MNRKSVLQIHYTTLTRILHFGTCLTNLCRFVSTSAGSPSEHVERSVADLARLSELLLYHTNIRIITQTIFTQDWKIRCFPTLILIPTFDSVPGGHVTLIFLKKKLFLLVFVWTQHREIPKHFRVTHHVCELDGEEEYTVSTSNLFGRKNDNTTMSKRKTKSKNGQGEPYFVDNKKGEVNELRQVRISHSHDLSL